MTPHLRQELRAALEHVKAARNALYEAGATGAPADLLWLSVRVIELTTLELRIETYLMGGAS